MTQAQPTDSRVASGWPTGPRMTPGQPTSLRVASGWPTASRLTSDGPTELDTAATRPALAPRALRTAVLAGAIACAAAACGSSAPGGAASTNPGAGASSAPGGSTPTVDVTAVDYKFEPSSLRTPQGRTTFQIRNAGAAEHEFEILQGDTVVGEVEGLVPGLSKSLTVDLAPGTYAFVCRLAGHDQLGMKGTLVVN